VNGLRYEYTTLGHVTIDVLDDGTRQPGGTAFYSALQAARLGLRTLIITRGEERELQELLDPYREELDLMVLRAPCTTTLQTSGSGSGRTQRVLAWAGRLGEDIEVDSTILHVAPVAREAPDRWRGSAEFVGLTPQGLVRDWSEADGEISIPETAPSANVTPAQPRDAGALALAERCDALVVSEHERASCAQMIAAAGQGGAVVAVTAGPGPNTILLPGGEVLEADVPAIEDACDDLGAGDIYAAAFFVALAEGAAAQGAAAFANAAAAVRMRGLGAPAIGTRSAIGARLHAVAGSPG
jgi:1D-myo-inositol 3-kinase